MFLHQVTIKRVGNALEITDKHGDIHLFNINRISSVKTQGNSVHIFCADGNGYQAITVPDKAARAEFTRRLARVMAHHQKAAYIRWWSNAQARG